MTWSVESGFQHELFMILEKNKKKQPILYNLMSYWQIYLFIYF